MIVCVVYERVWDSYFIKQVKKRTLIQNIIDKIAPFFFNFYEAAEIRILTPNIKFEENRVCTKREGY